MRKVTAFQSVISGCVPQYAMPVKRRVVTASTFGSTSVRIILHTVRNT